MNKIGLEEAILSSDCSENFKELLIEIVNDQSVSQLSFNGIEFYITRKNDISEKVEVPISSYDVEQLIYNLAKVMGIDPMKNRTSLPSNIVFKNAKTGFALPPSVSQPCLTIRKFEIETQTIQELLSKADKRQAI